MQGHVYGGNNRKGRTEGFTQYINLRQKSLFIYLFYKLINGVQTGNHCIEASNKPSNHARPVPLAIASKAARGPLH